MNSIRLTIVCAVTLLLIGCTSHATPTKKVSQQAAEQYSLEVQRGIGDIQTGRNVEASAAFTRALEHEETAEAYSNRALAYHRTGQVDKALRDHNKAVAP